MRVSTALLGKETLGMGKRKRHSAEQIVKKLEDAERRLTAGQNIAQMCQTLEISEATFHR